MSLQPSVAVGCCKTNRRWWIPVVRNINRILPRLPYDYLVEVAAKKICLRLRHRHCGGNRCCGHLSLKPQTIQFRLTITIVQRFLLLLTKHSINWAIDQFSLLKKVYQPYTLGERPLNVLNPTSPLSIWANKPDFEFRRVHITYPPLSNK